MFAMSVQEESTIEARKGNKNTLNQGFSYSIFILPCLVFYVKNICFRKGNSKRQTLKLKKR